MDEPRDLLIDDKGEIIIRNGTIATGPSTTQEVALLMLTNKGEWRHDVMAGCDLVRRMNTRITRAELERAVRIQCERDGKNWGDIKAGINLASNA